MALAERERGTYNLCNTKWIGQNFTVLHFPVVEPRSVPVGLPDAVPGEQLHQASGI